MANATRPTIRALVFVCAVASASACRSDGGARTPQNAAAGSIEQREDAYRANNRGVAWLEQFAYDKAILEFERALTLDASLGVARFNLALSLTFAGRVDDAVEAATRAAEALPGSARPPFVLGLLHEQANRLDEAATAFRRALALDASDVAARVRLGQVLLQQGTLAEAIAHLEQASAAEPFNASAAYALGQALIRANRTAESQRALDRFQSLREAPYAITYGQTYLSQGPLAEALTSTGLEPLLVDANTPDVHYELAGPAGESRAPGVPRASAALASVPVGRRFTVAEWTPAARRELAGSLGGALLPLDVDRDDDLDLVTVNADRQRLWRNDRGRFSDVTDLVGLAEIPRDSVGIGALAADYDNDGLVDLFVLRMGTSTLYRQTAEGRFESVSRSAGIPQTPHLSIAAAWSDLDHDGDTDLFIAGFADLRRTAPPRAGDRDGLLVFPDSFPHAPHVLLRNNGNGTFTDIAAEAGLAAVPARVSAIVPTDYDNRRDMDLVLVPYDGAPVLMVNQRDGTFRDGSAAAGLGEAGAYVGAGAADVNKDGFTDVLMIREGAPPVMALSDGAGRFHARPLALAPLADASFVDYDEDGVLDLLGIDDSGPRLWRGVGPEVWADVGGTVFSQESVEAVATAVRGRRRAVAMADLFGRARSDLAFASSDGTLTLLRLESRTRATVLPVRLAARVSNRTGLGAKVDVRAGSLRHRIETTSTYPSVSPHDLRFGLGARTSADVVRVLWPSGVVQAELPAGPTSSNAAANIAPTATTVSELDRKPSSCPFLFTWNGSRFEFVTDFLGGGETGYWLAPDTFNRPDPDELVRVDSSQLRERDGRFDLRATNELEEALYFDAARLIVVTHPAEMSVHPNEGMLDPPAPRRLHVARSLRPVHAAFDHAGRDVTERVAAIDGSTVDDLPLVDIRGFAERHALTLDLGAHRPRRPLLVLTGWTDYAFSSDNVAAHQRGLALEPPRLEVEAAPGIWRHHQVLGVPVGRPQTIVRRLDGLPAGATRLRIVTSMRVYWDAAAVGEEVDAPDDRNRVIVTTLALTGADLRERGFSDAVRPGTTGAPERYLYDGVSSRSPWKTPTGTYTPLGDVTPALRESDGAFVIAKPGDEIALTFDARTLAPPRAGWTRTFLLEASGFTREMNIRSARPHEVLPLPGRLDGHGVSPERQALAGARIPTGRQVRHELPSLELEALRLAMPPDTRSGTRGRPTTGGSR